MHKKIKTQQVLLTIGIPTYNRQEKLKKCLEYLENQQAINNVEILISDNASKDTTQAYIKQYINSHKLNIHYVRNKINEGFDKNILNLYKQAKGKYVWFLSDDDEIISGAVAHILYIIKHYAPAVIYPNQRDSKGKNVVESKKFIDIVPYMPTGIGMRVETNKKLLVNNDISRLVIVRLLSFISCCIVVKDKEVIKTLNGFVGTGILQDAITSLNLMRNPYAYIVKDPLIKGNDKEYFSRWFMESTLFGVRKLYNNPILHYPKNLSDKIALHNALFALFIIAQKKRLGVPVYYTLDIVNIRKLKRAYGKDFYFFIPVFVLILLSNMLPKIFIKWAYDSSYAVGGRILHSIGRR
jgi:glycosyltransferase involved in cell wall biosynthesis